MLNDPLANTFSVIMVHQSARKSSCVVTPVSSLAKKILDLMQQQHLIGAVDRISDRRGGIYRVSLLGAINACGVIKPRFAVTMGTYEKFEKRFLPAKNFGMMIVSTSKGIMTHEEAKKKGVGGKLIAYAY